MEKRNTRRRFIIIGIIVTVIIFAIMMLYIKSLNYSNPSEEIVPSEEVVKCITDKSIIYVSAGCPHCKIQIQKFGEDSVLLNIVDCTKTPEKCVEAGLRAVPTWIIDGKLIEGTYEIEELQNMTGC